MAYQDYLKELKKELRHDLRGLYIIISIVLAIIGSIWWGIAAIVQSLHK